MIAHRPAFSPIHPLTNNETHIWLLDTRTIDAALYSEAERLMSEDEKASAARRLRGKQEYIASRWLVRRVLSLSTGTAASRIQCRRSEKGKPSLDGVEFNLSHSGPYAVLAVHASAPVGIDVETINTRRTPLDIASHYFHESEVATLQTLSPDDQVTFFYQRWTLKEAMLKALGVGISAGLDQVVFDGNPLRVTFGAALSEHSSKTWHCHTWALDDHHICSLAIAPSTLTQVRWINAEDLLGTSFT